MALAQRISDRREEAQAAGNLGNAYLTAPSLRDLDQAEHWLQRSLSLRPDNDRVGRGVCRGQLGTVALQRFDDAIAAAKTEPVLLLQHLNTAIRCYQQALALFAADDHEHRGAVEHQLGAVFAKSDTSQALRHFQQAIQHHEARRDIFRAGQARYGIAILLAYEGRTSDALRFARAALLNYQQAGPGAAAPAAEARQLIARLEQR